MSTTPFPSLYPDTLLHHLTTTPRRARCAAHTIRRQPTRRQGRALEAIGHAIEYLVDSQMYFSCDPSTQPEVEASQILMQASRQVFAECREIAPLTTRVRQAILRLLSLAPTPACVR
jgi:hypothetical protein